jgi:hypothetical protein
MSKLMGKLIRNGVCVFWGGGVSACARAQPVQHAQQAEQCHMAGRPDGGSVWSLPRPTDRCGPLDLLSLDSETLNNISNISDTEFPDP